METTTKYENTLRQAMAKEFIKIGDAYNALCSLLSDKNSGQSVPQFLWKRVEDCASKYGDPNSLRIARSYYTDSEVPRKKWTTCARGALKKNRAWAAIESYQKAGVKHLPIKKILAAAEIELSTGNQGINYYLDICKQLKTNPSENVLLNRLAIAKINHSTHAYILIYTALNEPIDSEFIKQCYEYYLEKLDLRSIEYAAELLKIKITKKQCLALGKKAIHLGKKSAGGEFFERVYT